MGPLGTTYFQAPDNASVGSHAVALTTSGGTSDTVNIDVLASSGTWPAPRIEDVGVNSATPDGTTRVDLLVTVAAANLDIDATFAVNGATVTSTPFGGLPVDHLQDHVPSSYAYPVYHYLQHILVVDDVNLGSTLAITATNHDNQTATASYAIPASLTDLDSDGDGLLDSYDGGTYTATSGNTVNLAAMGSKALRKDILVEVDWSAAGKPRSGIWTTIESAFTNAPVLNPDGSAGVSILIDRGQGGAFTAGGQTVTPVHTTMDLGACGTCGTSYVDFFTYKANFFSADRLELFHYSVWGSAMPGGFSGRGEVWGNDFVVTFATFSNWNNDVDQVGTFIHELGHNLALRHGGIDDGAADSNQTFKPNMPSTMNYRYQFPGVSIDCDFSSEKGHS